MVYFLEKVSYLKNREVSFVFCPLGFGLFVLSVARLEVPKHLIIPPLFLRTLFLYRGVIIGVYLKTFSCPEALCWYIYCVYVIFTNSTKGRPEDVNFIGHVYELFSC